MKRSLLHLLAGLACAGLLACQGPRLTLLAINDVYEIAPLANGTEGGMARVATLRRQLQAQNPNTYLLHAGDFVSPSVIGTLRYEGKRIAGRQMIEVMNAAGVDYATFGNHEFDISGADLQARIDESNFEWVVANLRQRGPAGLGPLQQARNGEPKPLASSFVLPLGQRQVGVLAVAIPTANPFAEFEDPLVAAEREYQGLAARCDFVIALTHLEVAQDLELARRLSGLRLIIGGHDHENMRHQVGQTLVCKADANAKTAYVHYLQLRGKQLKIKAKLRKIDPSLPADPATEQVVGKWTAIANQSFAEMGFNAQEVVYRAPAPLDGLEKSVRNQATNLTELIGQAFLRACPQAEAVVYNSGSIRVDDKLAGNVTQYDVVRILPFGGPLVTVALKGQLLAKALASGQANRGIGGYLQTVNLAPGPNGQWLLKGQPLDPQRTYTVAMTDFLLTGREAGLDYLTPQNPDIQSVTPGAGNSPAADVRKALISYLLTLK
ncbi:MAG: bifunctional metallophosphatase/5'-nucleotidase [Bernardetiaceae bacterium]|jgi:5'-nucleotidase|nr:bifunctional metallophosphatase/5'-nucleotidase [Bernardetiaceae bacterium]